MKIKMQGSDIMTVGEKIQYYRKRAKLSQEDLGRELMLSRQTVSLWETGQTVPTIDNLIRLKEIFSVSIDEMLCVEEPSEKKTENLPIETCVYHYTEETLKARMKKALGTFKKPIFISCVCALITLIFLSIYQEMLSGFLFGFCFTLALIWVRSYFSSKKVWEGWRTRMMETEYRYEVYADCLIARFFRNDKNIYMKRIIYSDIVQLTETEAYYTFVYENENHCIYKKYLKEDSLLPTIFENCAPSQKILPRRKKKPFEIISRCLLIASVCSPFLAIAFATLLSDINGDFVGNMWTFLALLPILIASAFCGVYLCIKHHGGISNIVIGIVIACLLGLWGSFVFLF